MSAPPDLAALLPVDAACVIARSLALPTAAARLTLGHLDVRANGTLALATLESGSRSVPVVIKRLPPDLHEAAAYRCLLEAGAPVARLLGHAQHLGAETIVLEHLPRIGHGTEPAEFATVIAALARLNATAPAALPATPPGSVRRGLAHWRHAAAIARAGDWGEALAVAAAPMADGWEDLERLAAAIEAELAALPVAATHHDPCLGNCGWNEAGEVRYIDLSSATRHPLLGDLVVKCGASADPWPSADGPGPWLACFAEAYARAGGAVLAPERLARGYALHRAAHAMWLDATTFGRGDAWLRTHRPADTAHGWSWWYARTWRRLRAMRADGVDGATAT